MEYYTIIPAILTIVCMFLFAMNKKNLWITVVTCLLWVPTFFIPITKEIINGEVYILPLTALGYISPIGIIIGLCIMLFLPKRK